MITENKTDYIPVSLGELALPRTLHEMQFVEQPELMLGNVLLI